MQIVLPSLVSGLGLVFLLLGIFIDQAVIRIVFITVGAVLLWLDFFITMAIFRYNVRDTNRRMRRIEERSLKDQGSDGGQKHRAKDGAAHGQQPE